MNVNMTFFLLSPFDFQSIFRKLSNKNKLSADAFGKKIGAFCFVFSPNLQQNKFRLHHNCYTVFWGNYSENPYSLTQLENH